MWQWRIQSKPAAQGSSTAWPAAQQRSQAQWTKPMNSALYRWGLRFPARSLLTADALQGWAKPLGLVSPVWFLDMSLAVCRGWKDVCEGGRTVHLSPQELLLIPTCWRQMKKAVQKAKPFPIPTEIAAELPIPSVTDPKWKTIGLERWSAGKSTYHASWRTMFTAPRACNPTTPIAREEIERLVNSPEAQGLASLEYASSKLKAKTNT